MKKLLAKRNFSLLLVLIMAFTVSIVVLSKVDERNVLAASDYSATYTGLADEKLDLLTNRDVVSNEGAEITVFVHGLGSQAFHWSNDGDNHFSYQQSSMPEQLRKTVGTGNAKIYGVKVGYDLSQYTGKNFTQEEAKSDAVDTNDIATGDISKQSYKRDRQVCICTVYGVEVF